MTDYEQVIEVMDTPCYWCGVHHVKCYHCNRILDYKEAEHCSKVFHKKRQKEEL